MAETTWTEEQTTGPKKRTVPTWAWFCGGGCLLAVLIAVVAIGLGVRAVNSARDPDIQLPQLAKVLPYDEWPKEMELAMGMHLVGDQYTFQDSRGFQVQFQNHSGSDGSEARRNLFDSEKPQFPQNMGVMKFESLEPDTVEVQGRVLRLIRMRMEFSDILKKMMPEEAREGMGSLAFVDLTPEGREGMLMMQITRMKGPEPVSDDEIQMLLKPFHVGPNR